MILRLLIAASLVLAITQYYLTDGNQQKDIVKPKQQIENIQNEMDKINQEAEEKRKKALEELGL